MSKFWEYLELVRLFYSPTTILCVVGWSITIWLVVYAVFKLLGLPVILYN